MTRRSLVVKSAVVCGILGALVAAVTVPRAAEGKPVCAKPRYRNLVLVSTRTGRVDRSFPDASSPPLAMVTDGRGGWFVAMPDYCIGSVFVNGIAHLRPNGRLDKRWHGRVPHTPIQGAVGELIRVGGTLYAASGAWVEALDARTGNRRWQVTNRKGGWGTGLAASGSTVFVGGFGGSPFAGKRRWGPVALDARTGKVVPWHAALGRKLYVVGPLALDRGRLFMAEPTANGYSAIVAVDARTGRLTDWRAPQIKETGNLLVTHGLLFTTNSVDNHSYVASATTGQPVAGFGSQGLTGFSAITASGNTLYAWGGGPGCTGGGWKIQGQTRKSVAAVNLRTLKLTAWAPATRTRYVCLQALAADPRQVLIAGPLTAPNPANG